MLNLGQGVGQNLILSKDFNSFYDTAMSSARAIAEIARSKELSDGEQASINQALGKIQDYTVPTVPLATPCPACPVCQGQNPCPACAAPDNTKNILLAAAALVAGLSLGALLL